jgi:hypothetical protein
MWLTEVLLASSSQKRPANVRGGGGGGKRIIQWKMLKYDLMIFFWVHEI